MADNHVGDAVELSDGNLLITMRSETEIAKHSLVIMTFTPGGSVVWQRLHGAVNEDIWGGQDSGRNALATQDGGAIVAVRGSNTRLLHVDAKGNIGGDCSVTVPASMAVVDWKVAFPPVDATLLPGYLKTADAPLTPPETSAVQFVPYCEPRKQLDLQAVTAAPHKQVPAIVEFEAAEDARDKLREDVIALVLAKNWNKLDEMADKFRSSHEMFELFASKLEVFYEGVSSLSIDAAVGTKQHIALMKEWRKAKPRSAAAVIALAATLDEEAWFARGPGFIDTITEEGADQYESLRRQAIAALDDGKEIGASDPHYWAMRIKAEGNAIENLKAAGDVGHWYPFLYFVAMRFTSPQWGGTREDFIAITNLAVEHTREIYGDGMYARLAWKLSLFAGKRDDAAELEQFGFSWPRVKAAYLALIERYPKHLPDYHELAFFAARNNDYELLRRLFTHPEMGWGSAANRVWSKPNYDAAKQWMGQPPDPPSRSETQEQQIAKMPFGKSPSQWPVLVQRTSFTMKDGRVVDSHWSFNVKTARGGAVVSTAEKVFDDYNVKATPDLVSDAIRTWTIKPSDGASFNVGPIAAMKWPLIIAASSPMRQSGQMLEPRRTSSLIFDRVYVVLGGPQQSVMAGMVEELMPEPRLGDLVFVEVPTQVDWRNYFGCPILDEDGKVIGAITAVERSSNTGRSMPGAAILGPLLDVYK